MRTTLNLDDELMARAAAVTGETSKTELVHRALRALVAHEAGQRLAKLGGTEKRLRPIPRRRFP